jgi:hypothetical protein
MPGKKGAIHEPRASVYLQGFDVYSPGWLSLIRIIDRGFLFFQLIHPPLDRRISPDKNPFPLWYAFLQPFLS